MGQFWGQHLNIEKCRACVNEPFSLLFDSRRRTLLHERLDIDPHIIEHQLAHRVPDVLGQAYNRTKFIKQRKIMMQLWADYLDALKSDLEGMR